MANWRKTKRKGKLTTTQNSSGKSSISKRVISSSNLNVNKRYVRGGTITRTTYKSGGYTKIEQSSNIAKRTRLSPRKLKSGTYSKKGTNFSDLKRDLGNAVLLPFAIIYAFFRVFYYFFKFCYYLVYYLVFIPYKYLLFIPLTWLIRLLFPRTINDVNLKIKDLKETIKTGRDKFKKNMKTRWDKFKKNIAIR